MLPEEAALPVDLFSAPEPPAIPQPRGIAPLWHTILLIAAILIYSFWGAQRADRVANNPLAPTHQASPADKAHTPAALEGHDPLRLLRYALSGGLELAVVGWIAFGLRLRHVPFRSLFGTWPHGLNDITKEAGIAALFWFASMLVLVSVALTWNAVETQVYKYQLRKQQQTQSTPAQTPQTKPESPQQKQAEAIRQLMDLAPANGIEIAAWGLLCLIVGFSEELIFRGYLQAQGIAVLHRIPLTIILTSLIFGLAHGYQGLRGMVIISVYGALFSILTRLRRSLFPGMLAHGWHDFATGLLLALIRATHLLEHMPLHS